jgi:hypothetical protein
LKKLGFFGIVIPDEVANPVQHERFFKKSDFLALIFGGRKFEKFFQKIGFLGSHF